MDEQKMIHGEDVSNFIKGFFSFLKRAILFVLSALRQRFAVGLLVFVSLLFLGWYSSYKQEPVYESEMSCVYNNMGHFAYGQVVNNLDLLIKSKSYRSLAQKLNLSEDQVRAIKSIKARNMAGGILKDDFSPDRSPMYFTVKATNADIFLPLQDALLNYLNTFSPYQLLRNDIGKKISAKKAEYLARDVSLIDSILSGYKSFLSNAKSISDSSSFSDINALLVYKDKIEDKAIAAVEMDPKVLQHSVELYYGFASPDKPSVPEITSLLLIIFGSFIAACMSCVVIKLLYN